MRSLRLGFVGVVLVLLGGVWAGSPAGAATKEVDVVDGQAPGTFAFTSPASLASGDSLVWNNKTSTGHIAHADDAPASFADVPISPSAKSSPVVITGPARDIPYHCTIHPTMTGTIHVTAVIAPAPTTTTTAKPIAIPPTTKKPAVTTTSRATTSTTEASTTTSEETTTTSEETTTTAGQVAIKTKGGGSNGAAIAVLALAIAAVLGGGGYALYRMRRP